MKKRIMIFLFLIIVVFAGGCSNQVQKYTFTEEELGEIPKLPEYKIWIGPEYLRMEMQNQGEHLVPLDLLRIAFPEYLSDIPDDGAS
jgi:hypothetical protein